MGFIEGFKRVFKKTPETQKKLFERWITMERPVNESTPVENFLDIAAKKGAKVIDVKPFTQKVLRKTGTGSVVECLIYQTRYKTLTPEGESIVCEVDNLWRLGTDEEVTDPKLRKIDEKRNMVTAHVCALNIEGKVPQGMTIYDPLIEMSKESRKSWLKEAERFGTPPFKRSELLETVLSLTKAS